MGEGEPDRCRPSESSPAHPGSVPHQPPAAAASLQPPPPGDAGLASMALKRSTACTPWAAASDAAAAAYSRVLPRLLPPAAPQSVRASRAESTCRTSA